MLQGFEANVVSLEREISCRHALPLCNGCCRAANAGRSAAYRLLVAYPTAPRARRPYDELRADSRDSQQDAGATFAYSCLMTVTLL